MVVSSSQAADKAVQRTGLGRLLKVFLVHDFGEAIASAPVHRHERVNERVNDMKRALVISIITAGVAIGSGVASANSTYWRQSGLLLEVSADPRDGSDFVQTNPTRASRLELVALNDAVRLRGMTVYFADGRAFSQRLTTIVPGQRVMVDLPGNRGVIRSVQLDYGRQIVHRTPARLQIIPRADRDRRYGHDDPTYYPRPSYRTQPSYYVPPRSSWSGSIQGSFRF